MSPAGATARAEAAEAEENASRHHWGGGCCARGRGGGLRPLAGRAGKGGRRAERGVGTGQDPDLERAARSPPSACFPGRISASSMSGSDDRRGRLFRALKSRIDLSLVDLALGRVAPTRVGLRQPTWRSISISAPFAGRFDGRPIVASRQIAPIRASAWRTASSWRRAAGGLDTVIEGVRGGSTGCRPARE